MAKPFFDDEQKQSLLLRLANGEDPEDLTSYYGLTEKQIHKYKYNHKKELEQIANDFLMCAYCADLPPLDRVKRVFGDRFKTKHNRLFLDGRAIIIKEVISKANIELIQEGKKLIYYPGIIEPGG